MYLVGVQQFNNSSTERMRCKKKNACRVKGYGYHIHEERHVVEKKTLASGDLLNEGD